ncbi:MAG: radical SAM protein [Planctomycetes bacterium]|nr:radical SAM protein [Planctomycetota bacterium]
MDILLISPPVANFGQCSSGLSVLTAFLRARGFEASQWDLAIEAFHHFHSPEYLGGCLDSLERAGLGDVPQPRDINGRLPEEEDIRVVARRVVAEIEGAKAALQRPGIERDQPAMRWAFQTIADAGVVMTAAAQGRYEHDFRHFGIDGAFRSYETLEAAIQDRASNPYIPFLEEVALPRILRDRPRAVGISMTYFSQVVPGFTLARLLRERAPEVKLVMGGAYLTAVEDQVHGLPARLAPVDAIILHDGEEALERWLKAVLQGEGRVEDVPNSHLPSPEGVFARAGERNIVHTDLDLLPVPMWTLDGLDLSRYLVPRYPIPLPLSRGCYWGRCSFCNISCQTSATYRTRPVEKAIADIKAAIAQTGSNWFDFPVDSFRPKELHALAQAIIAEGLEIEWGAEVLLDPGFKDPVIADLARSGCRCLRFGLESANVETLTAMNKPTRPGEARRILETCKKNGIQTAVMLIAGFPTETQARLWETYDYLVENADRIDFLTIHSYSLVPGSPMAQDPGRFGLYLLPPQAVLWTSLPFVNTNPVGMRNEDLPRVVQAMREGLREHYPDLGEMWTVAIGGWMTFPACCGVRRDLVHPTAGG